MFNNTEKELVYTKYSLPAIPGAEAVIPNIDVEEPVCAITPIPAAFISSLTAITSSAIDEPVPKKKTGDESGGVAVGLDAINLYINPSLTSICISWLFVNGATSSNEFVA